MGAQESSLYNAAKRGELEKINLALSTEPDLVFASTFQKKNTLLHLAAKHGHPELVRSLLLFVNGTSLHHGNRLNALSRRSTNSTHGVRAAGLLRLSTPALLRRSTSSTSETPLTLIINAANSKGQTPLMLAAKFGRRECIEVLLRLGADPWIGDSASKDTAVHYAAKYSSPECVCEFLAAAPRVPSELWPPNTPTTKLVDVQNSFGFTPLHYAAASGDAQTVQAVLLYEPRLSIPTIKTMHVRVTFPDSSARSVDMPSGTRVLHLAAVSGSGLLVKLVLEAAMARNVADPRHFTDTNGALPYMVAANSSHWHLTHLLIPSNPIATLFPDPSQPAQRTPIGPPSLSHLAAAAWVRQLMVSIAAAESAMLTQMNRPASSRSLRSAASSLAALLPTHPSLLHSSHHSVAGLAGEASAASTRASSLELHHSRATPAQDAGSSLGDDLQCCVCFETQVRVSAAGCKHGLCISCARKVCAMHEQRAKPPACPFCQRCIAGFELIGAA